MSDQDKQQPYLIVRRMGAEAAISLRKRRKWYDETETQPPNPPAGAQNTDETGQENAPVPYERFKVVNQAKKEAEAELAKYREAERKRIEKEALDKGEFEKVIEGLRPKADRVDQLEQTLREYLESEKASVPENMRDLIPQGDVTTQLQWIKNAKAKGLFTPQTAPNTDAGARGDRGEKLPQLSAEENQIARAMGLTQEAYAKRKAEIAAERNQK